MYPTTSKACSTVAKPDGVDRWQDPTWRSSSPGALGAAYRYKTPDHGDHDLTCTAPTASLAVP